MTVAHGQAPRLAQRWHSGQLIERTGTLIGWNAGEPVRTPHDRCWLIMPTLVHALPGATLVWLARERVAAEAAAT